MKKTLIKIAVIVVVCLVALLLVASFFLGSIIKKGVETVGPQITKTPLTLDGANLSILSGSGSIKGLLVGNPEGYKTESAIKVGSVSLGVRPGSVFSDKIHVTHVNIQAPQITFEGGLKNNNLTKILDNVQAATGGPDTNQPAAKDQGPSKKIQIDDLVVSGAKVTISTVLTAGKPVTVTIPDIHLTDLGKNSNGITPAEATEIVLKEVVNGTLKAVEKAIADVGKVATEALKDVGKGGTGTVDKATKSLKGLLGK